MAEGYIILTSGDTLFGKIKKLSPFVLSEYVVFQKNETEVQSKYYPAQVSKYYFDISNYYVSDSVPFRKANGMVYYRRVFLKQLVEGAMDLHSLDYRMIEDPSPLHEYQSKFYFIGNSEEGYQIDLNDRDYLDQFYSAFKEMECSPKLNGKNPFTDEGLSNLIMAYNECLGKPARRIYIEEKKN